jgi:hypothetical protein
MYVCAYDPVTLTQVNLHGHGSFSPEVFERAAGDAERFVDDARRRGAVACWLVVIRPESEAPNATQRKRMAEIKSRFGPLRVTTVATSLVHRGVLTALKWLAPHRPGQHVVTASTVEEALTWHESMAGGSLPVLRELTAQVLAEAARQAKSRLAG